MRYPGSTSHGSGQVIPMRPRMRHGVDVAANARATAAAPWYCAPGSTHHTLDDTWVRLSRLDWLKKSADVMAVTSPPHRAVPQSTQRAQNPHAPSYTR